MPVKSLPLNETPKFFFRDLTGKGGKIGVINDTIGPTNVIESAVTKFENQSIDRNINDAQSGVTHRFIPTAPIIEALYHQGIDIEPNTEDAVKVGSLGEADIFFRISPQAVIYYVNTNREKNVKTVYPRWRMEVFATTEDHNEPLPNADVLTEHTAKTAFTLDVPGSYETFIKNALPQDTDINTDAISDYLYEVNFYEQLCGLAKQWSAGQVAYSTVSAIESVARRYDNEEPWDVSDLNALEKQMRYLQNHALSLDGYRMVYEALSAHLPDHIVTPMVSNNQYLLMNNVLEELRRAKPEIPTIDTHTEEALKGIDPRSSDQQRQIITTDEPVVLVQAGAGTGKSSTMVERIKYLIASGVKPEDITTLSFTNAAADNLREKIPGINSVTNASFIQTIYMHNHQHMNSEADTIINLLQSDYAQISEAQQLVRLLMEIKSNKVGAMTNMATFINGHYETIMNILDEINQTTLELQIIICLLELEHLSEPEETNTKYIIIDEVQDNSIFEFIFFLRRSAIRKVNTMTVGDSSQTLYEFRSANPKALNALETSGVFTTYQLTTNYRSNQAILTLANKGLSDIEANQFANIQLQSFSNPQTTLDEFDQSVHISHHPYRRAADFNADLEQLLATEIVGWIKSKMAKKEKVCFMAYTRDHVAKAQSVFERLIPEAVITNITSDKVVSSTLLSKYVLTSWNDIKQVYPPQAHAAIYMQIQQDIHEQTSKISNPEKARRAGHAMMNILTEWDRQNRAVSQVLAQKNIEGQLSDDEFFAQMRANLINFEVTSNNEKRSIVSARNQARKETNATKDPDIIISTIHGNKGLEFDHVGLLYKDSKEMREDDKRLYYVALTRAMKSEFILSYSTDESSNLEQTYDLIRENLKELQTQERREKIAQIQNVEVDEITDDPQQLQELWDSLAEDKLNQKRQRFAQAVGIPVDAVNKDASAEELDALLEMFA